MAADGLTLDELKDLGSGQPAPDRVVRLYHQAFDAFGTRALWNWRHLGRPTVTRVLAIADSLRMEGNLAARRLAEQIEQACRAALWPAKRHPPHIGGASQPGELRGRFDAASPRRSALFGYMPHPADIATNKAPAVRQGLWPGSSEIGHAMLERYGKPPP